MTDWSASFSRHQHWYDRMGWAASAAAVILFFAAGTAIAMRLQLTEGMRDAVDEAILLDMQPLPPAPALIAMAEPAPDAPMTDAPEGLPSPGTAEDAPPPVGAPDQSPAQAMAEPSEALPALVPDTVSADISLPPPPRAKPVPKPTPKPDAIAKADPVPDAIPTAKPEAKPNPKPKAAAAPAKPAAAPPPAQQSASVKAAAPTPKPGKATAAVPKGRIKDLVARWGASIRAKVQKRNSYPKAAKGATGTVTLRLKVARGGALQSVSIAGSSGNQTLDAAAVQAVKRAGKFSAAPKELTDASYGFTLQLEFAR